MDTASHPYSEQRRFFSELLAYVPTFQDNAGDKRIATERTAGGRAILCYRSPVDALTEVLRFIQMGQRFEIMPAEQVRQDAFLDADGHGLITDVHLAWLVIDGRLQTRPGGALGGYTRLMHHRVHVPPSFEFDERVLTEVARLHEWAGLYAWRETLDYVHTWHPARLVRVAARALKSIRTEKRDAPQCRQVALFDPEAEQWHFVPCGTTVP
ncbi:hypothetical protein [Paraburkholderia sp. SUR17]|uniref:hypothetical protein n=1 Tax=Paraburkholderia sp. SUR17 TaxID=3034358 RepID=UPI0024080054|nr:hypothetical protein [Paraburkholderia sp. SUR17]WEY41015.1 hypothetical protein P2869_26385 [Paraburkholderia sp. SUR17]